MQWAGMAEKSSMAKDSAMHRLQSAEFGYAITKIRPANGPSLGAQLIQIFTFDRQLPEY